LKLLHFKIPTKLPIKLPFKIKIRKEHLNTALMIISAAVFLYSLSMIGYTLYSSFRNKNLMSEAQRLYYEQQQFNPTFTYKPSFDSLLRSIVMNEAAAAGQEDGISSPAGILPEYKPLLEITEDIVGWISIPNTVVNYPVVQADDNEYYLNRAYTGEKNKGGSIFMDFRNRGDGTDRNTILYGHHMRDGSMFKALTRYQDEEFLKENSVFSFNTLYDKYSWKVFSVYVTGTDFNYIQTRFHSPDEYQSFLDRIKAKSLFDIDVELTEEDKIITLSTCTYDYSDARLVIHAKLIESE
jgi:sortase B